MWLMRQILAILLVNLFMTGVALTAWGASGPTKIITIRWAEYAAEGDIKFASINRYAKRVEDLTKDKVKIEVYPSEGLCKTREMFEALMEGRIDMALLAPPYYVGKMPALDLYNAPSIIASRPGEISLLEARGEHIRFLEDEFRKFNMKYLRWGAEAPNGVLVTKDKLIKTTKDVENLKLRGPGIQDKMIRLWGGQGVSIPRPEVYTAVQRGIVDGTYFSLAGTRVSRLWEVASYMTDTSVPMGGMLAVMNMDLWNDLPGEVKQAFEVAAKEMPPFTMEVQKKYSEETLTFLKEKFKEVYVIEPNSAVFESFWKPVRETLVPDLIKKLGPRYKEWHNLMMKEQQAIRAEKGW